MNEPFFLVHDVAQRSPEWFALRLGKITGSCANDLLSQPKKKGDPETAARRNLRVALALERVTREPDEETFTSRDIKRGEAMEPDARRAYEAATGRLLTTVGFLAHPTLAAGCSPDGLFLTDGILVEGLVDFKCPRPGNHLEYLRGDFPLEYRRQLTHNLWITGAQWAEMVSYCPKFQGPVENLRLCVHRLTRDAVDLEAYENTVRAFLDEVDREVASLQTMADTAAVLRQSVEVGAQC